MHVFALQHAQGDTCRHAGIDRIAAGFQDLESGLCREIIGRRHHVLRTKDTWMVRGHAMPVSHGDVSCFSRYSAAFGMNVVGSAPTRPLSPGSALARWKS